MFVLCSVYAMWPTIQNSQLFHEGHSLNNSQLHCDFKIREF